MRERREREGEREGGGGGGAGGGEREEIRERCYDASDSFWMNADLNG